METIIKGIKLVKGNLLDATEQYIAHQCNTTSKGSAGLAKAIFDKFPYANTYERRASKFHEHNVVGTINVLGNGADKRYIINMYAQVYPGKHRDVQSFTDGEASRRLSFLSCLYHIAEIKDIKSIAFPFAIGCGLAGGNWKVYSSMLEDFAAAYRDIEVAIYKLES